MWRQSILQLELTKKPFQIAIFLLLITPTLVIAAISFYKAYYDLTQVRYTRGQMIAYLSSLIINDKLDHLKEIGLSLATRVQFRKLVGKGKWEESIQILKNIPKDFPTVDRIFLSDISGNLMADSPALPKVRGVHFSERDWYQGVSRDWTPYISNVYLRSAEPRYNVIAVAIPILSDEKNPLGILVMQIRVDSFFAWSRAVELEEEGFIYFTDRKGQILAHPKFDPQGEIVNFSQIGPVAKALTGAKGIEVQENSFEKEEYLSAYAPVTDYGWTIVAQQKTHQTFATRNRTLLSMFLVYGMLLLLNAFLAFVILRTIARLKQANELSLSLNQQLQNSNRELESFSYSVSHDFRAPLRSIIGFGKIFNEEYGSQIDQTGLSYLKRMTEAAKRMGLLIDGLLDLTRLNRLEILKKNVDLSHIAEEIIARLKEEEPQRSVNVTIENGLIAKGDERLLRALLDNLLRNAWKFSSKKQEAAIEFGMKSENGKSVFFVRDNGAGFDMTYAHKLFGPFQRLHGATEFQGTGIGLATAQRIVNRHGGRIWAEGLPNQGSVFYFIL